MTRSFDFKEDVKQEVIWRQSNLCAVCGKSLKNVEDNAHHVVPDQAGKPGSSVDTFLSKADNCVYVCYLCHQIVHAGGKTRLGAVAPPSYFKYFSRAESCCTSRMGSST